MTTIASFVTLLRSAPPGALIDDLGLPRLVLGAACLAVGRPRPLQPLTRSRTVALPPASAGEVETICDALLAQVYPFRRGIRLLGVTNSALAAGCPVVVKGHPAHPGALKAVVFANLERWEQP